MKFQLSDFAIMKKINFKTIIRAVNILLGIIVFINFAYFLVVVLKNIKTSKESFSGARTDTEINSIIAEFEKNTDKIKNLILHP